MYFDHLFSPKKSMHLKFNKIPKLKRKEIRYKELSSCKLQTLNPILLCSLSLKKHCSSSSVFIFLAFVFYGAFSRFQLKKKKKIRPISLPYFWIHRLSANLY